MIKAFLEGLALDAHGAVLVSIALFYGLAASWVLLGWLLRKPIARQKARRALIDQLAQTPEIKLHAWHQGLQYPVEKAAMADKLRAQGYPIDAKIIDEALHRCLQKKFKPDLVENRWLFAIGQILDRYALWLVILFGTLVIFTLARLWSDPMSRVTIFLGLLFAGLLYKQYGLRGAAVGFLVIFLMCFLATKVILPFFVNEVFGIRDALHDALLATPPTP